MSLPAGLAYGKTPQLFGRDPIESFREHVWVAPFYEDNITHLRDLHGADRILLGSDWPHPEGLSEPRAWLTITKSRSGCERVAMAQLIWRSSNTSTSWSTTTMRFM